MLVKDIGAPKDSSFRQGVEHRRLRLSLDMLNAMNRRYDDRFVPGQKPVKSSPSMPSRRRAGFEDIGISNDEAALFHHMMKPWKHRKVPDQYKDSFNNW